MKITGVDHFKLEMELSSPYTIAYQTVKSATNIILKVDTDSGITGWGCAAPDKYITGENPDDVIRNIGDVAVPLLMGESPYQLAMFTHTLREKLGVASSTIAMVDIALNDLLARRSKLPLYRILGGYRKSIRTSITIGILPVDETISKAEAYLNEGFTILKLKGGLSLEEDIEKVISLREKFGPGFKLRFDANQGYSPEQAVEFMKQSKKAKIEILEQPVSPLVDDHMGQVSNNIMEPVMADESIKNLQDAYRLASNKQIDMVNIKIQKVGGILESQHINSVAKAAKMEVMVGCLDECALGISSGLHFALSRRNIRYADLDSHFDMVNDPFKGLFHFDKGVLYPTDDPGLGNINI